MTGRAFVPGSARSTRNLRLSMESRVNGDSWTRNSATTVDLSYTRTVLMNDVETFRHVQIGRWIRRSSRTPIFSLSLLFSSSFHPFLRSFGRRCVYTTRRLTNSFTANSIISAYPLSIYVPRALPLPPPRPSRFLLPKLQPARAFLPQFPPQIVRSAFFQCWPAVDKAVADSEKGGALESLKMLRSWPLELLRALGIFYNRD